MFKLHKKVKYALTALKHMKKKPVKDLSSAKEICDLFEIPFDPTSRVLQIMAQNGIVEAVQGARGGYRIIGNLGAVTLHELSDMVAGQMAITDCTSNDCECERLDKCVLKKEMAMLNSRIVRVFKDIPVSEMV